MWVAGKNHRNQKTKKDLERNKEEKEKATKPIRDNHIPIEPHHKKISWKTEGKKQQNKHAISLQPRLQKEQIYRKSA